MRLLGLVAFACALGSACSGRMEVPERDAGVPIDVAAAVDAPSEIDAATSDSGGDASTAEDAPSVADAAASDAGRDAPASDVGRDAPSIDGGQPGDAGCAAYCDPATGSYYTCVGGSLRCMCGPCSGDPLACC